MTMIKPYTTLPAIITKGDITTAIPPQQRINQMFTYTAYITAASVPGSTTATMHTAKYRNARCFFRMGRMNDSSCSNSVYRESKL